MHQRRLDQREHDEDVHRAVSRQTGGAHALGKAHTPVNLHGAGVAPLHLREECRCVLLLDEHAAHAAQREVDSERQAGRSAADDKNLCIHGLFLITHECFWTI